MPERHQRLRRERIVNEIQLAASRGGGLVVKPHHGHDIHGTVSRFDGRTVTIIPQRGGEHVDVDVDAITSAGRYNLEN